MSADRNVTVRILSALLVSLIAFSAFPVLDIDVEAATLAGTSTTLTSGGTYEFGTGTLSYTGVSYTVAANASVTVTVPAGANVTINNTASGGSPFLLNTGSTLNLVVNGTLTVRGQAGTYTQAQSSIIGTFTAGTAGYAGINVPSGSTLNVSGTGTLYAYGGAAGRGADSNTFAGGSSDIANYGGGGGGGAGAGIGGNGGKGGAGGESKYGIHAASHTASYTENGGTGQTAGTIVLGSKVYAYGGAGGAGGRGDDISSADGGGGGGYPAAGIGGGGAGGGGGTSGTAGGGYSGGSTASSILGGTDGAGAAGLSSRAWEGTGGGYKSAGVIRSYNTNVVTGGGIGGQGSTLTVGNNTRIYAAGDGGTGGGSGTIKIHTSQSNIIAQNGSNITFNRGAAQKISGIGSGAGYIEVASTAVELGSININMSGSGTITAVGGTNAGKTGTFATIGTQITGVSVNTSTQTVTLSNNADGLPYQVTGSSTTYNIAVASGMTGEIILKDATINMSAIAGKSPISLVSGAKPTIELEGTSRLTAGPAGEAGDGPSTTQLSGGTGAGAGIAVPSGATLNIVGDGTLYAFGGDASDGGDGGGNSGHGKASGPTAIVTEWDKVVNNAGGGGGGGAGAGIGGVGGAGAVGGGANTATASFGATEGYTGGAGGGAGSITVNARVYAYGGGGGAGGDTVNSFHGAGAGGGGYPAAGIGGGGAGGGSGAGRVYTVSVITSGYHFAGGGGFSGGAGGGRWGYSYGGADGNGGEGGTNNSTGSGQVFGSGGGGYFSAGTVWDDTTNKTYGVGGAIGGGGGYATGGSVWKGGAGGAGGAGGSIVIMDATIVTAQNGSKITGSSSATQNWSATNATSIVKQGGTQGYGAGAGYSETNGTVTITGAPGAPTGVNAAIPDSSVTGTDVLLSWTPPTNTGGTGVSIIGYQILSTQFNYSRYFTTSEISGTSTLSVTISGLPANTEGTFEVAAVNDKTGGSVGVSKPVKTMGVPLAPNGLLIEIGDDEHDRATVYWNPPTDNGRAISGYVINLVPVGQADVSTEGKNDVVMEEVEEGGMMMPVKWDAKSFEVPVGLSTEYPSDKDEYALKQVVTGLKYGTVYFITVSAINAAGTGEPIADYGETAGIATAPEVSVTRKNDDADKPVGMDVSFTRPDNADGIPEITSFLVTRSAKDASNNTVADAAKTWSFVKQTSEETVELTEEVWFATLEDGEATITLTVTKGDDGVIRYSFTDEGDETATLFESYRYGHTYSYTVQGQNVAGYGIEGVGGYTFEPTVPTDIAAERGNKQIILSWMAPADNGGLIEYIIYRKNSESGEFEQVGVPVAHEGFVNKHTFTDTNLENGTEYTYKIAAVNASGEGPMSDEVTALTLKVPAQVTTVNPVAQSRERIDVFWTTPAEEEGEQPILGYRVRYYSASGTLLGTKEITVDEAKQTQNEKGEFVVSFTGLDQGTVYDFTVVAYNSIDEGPVGDGKRSAATHDKPSAPLNVKAEPVVDDDGNSKLKITWTKPTNNNGATILRYFIYAYSEDTSLEDITNGTATHINMWVAEGENTLEKEIDGLESGQTYIIAVSAYNNVGESAKNTTEGTAMNKPHAPTTFTAETFWRNNGAEVDLNWNDAYENGSTITYYQVDVFLGSQQLTASEPAISTDVATGRRVCTYDLGDGKKLVITYGTPKGSGGDLRNTNSATVSGLEKATEYRFWVRAKNEVDLGTPAEKYCTTVSEPFGVSNLKAEPVNESGKIRVTWGVPENTGRADIISYVINLYDAEYSDASAIGSTEPIETETVYAGDPLSVDFTGLTDGKTYTVMVYAVNIVGNGTKLTANVIPRRPAAAPESSIKLIEATNGTVADVSWINPTGDDLGGDTILSGENGYVISIYDEDMNLVARSGKLSDDDVLPKSDIVFGGADIGVEDENARTVRISNLVSGKKYVIVVNVMTKAGPSADSEMLEFTTWKLSGRVSNPSADATNYTGGIIVSWDYPYDDGDGDSDRETNETTDPALHTSAYDYTVMMKKDVEGAEWTTSYVWSSFGENIAGIDENGRYFLRITGLEDGQDYKFRVLVENGAGTTELEDSIELSAHSRRTPQAPTIGEVLTGNASATITWIKAPEEWVTTEEGETVLGNGGDPITGYKIYAALAREIDGEWVPSETPQYKTTFNLQIDDVTGLPIMEDLYNVPVPGLENNQNYLITVRAINGACVDEQADGGIASAGQYVRVGMPLAPENLRVGLGSGNSVVSTYTAAEGNGSPILYYHVYVNGDPYKLEMENGQLVEKDDPIQFKTTVSTVYGTMMGDEVEIQVSAVNRVGESPRTAPVKVIVGAPTTPEINTLTLFNDSVELTWSEAVANGSKFRGYKIYLKDVTPDVTPEEIVFPSAGTDEADFIYMDADKNLIREYVIPSNDNTTLQLGHQYMVQVAASNLAGEGPRSAARYFTFGVPGAPTITEINSGEGQLTVKFMPPEDVGGADLDAFHVYANGRSTPVAKLWIEGRPNMPTDQDYVVVSPTVVNGVMVYALDATDADGETYATLLEGLANGSTYSIQVSALNVYGEGDLSMPLTGTPATIAGAPNNVKATATSATAAFLEWTAPAYNGGSSINGYEISVYEADTDSEVIQSEGGVEVQHEGIETTATITGLSKATRYYFKVRATTIGIDKPGVERESNIIATYNDPGQPTIVDWTATLISGKNYSLTIEWEPPEDTGGTEILGYNIYCWNSGTTTNMYKPRNTSGEWKETNFTINNLTHSRSYVICVEAVNEVGSMRSETRTVKIGQASAPVVTNIYTDLGDDFGGNAYFEWETVSEASDGYLIFDMEYILHDILGRNDTPEEIAKMTSSEVTEVFNSSKIKLDDYYAEIFEEGATASSTVLTELEIGKTYYYVLTSYAYIGGTGMVTKVYPVTIGAPESPVIHSAEGGYNSVNLTWKVPEKNVGEGTGNELIGYKLYVNGIAQEMIDVSDVTVDDTTATYSFPVDASLCGTECSIELTAISKNTSSGDQYESLKSQAKNATPWTNPSTPEDLVLVAGNASFTATFKKSNGNGLEVKGYTVYWDGAQLDPKQVSAVDNGDGTMTLTVTGVRNGYKDNGEKHQVYVAAYTIEESGTRRESAAPNPMPELATGIPAAPEITTAVVDYNASTLANTIIVGYLDSEIITGSTERSYVVKILKSGADEDTAREIPTSDTTLTIEYYKTAGDFKTGESYEISVQAVNDFGEGPFSKKVVVTIGAPKAPKNVAAIPGNGMATVTWTAPESNAGPITMYEMYVRDKDGNLEIIQVDRHELMGEIKGLDNGSTYTVTVVAKNEYGTSVESSACTVTPGTEPSAPASAEAVALNDTQVKVTWTEPEDNGGMDITYYVIRGGGKETTSSASQAKEVIIDGLERGKTYTFTVEANNQIGASAESATTNEVTTHTLPGKPSWEGLESSDSTIIAKWYPPTVTGGSDIISYTMYISKYDNNMVDLIEVHTIEDITPTELDYNPYRNYITYVVPADQYSLDVGTEYKVSIAARNSTVDGLGEPSDNISKTVIKGTIDSEPGEPNRVDATAADGQVEVVWVAPTYTGGGIDNYYVYYREEGSETYENPIYVDSTKRSTVVKNLTNNVTYEFFVSANNTHGESGLSGPATATPIHIEKPNAPTNPRYTSNTANNKITFRWDPPTNQDGTGASDIYYEVFLNNETDIASATVTDPYFRFDAVIGTPYTLEVRAVNEGGKSDRVGIEAMCTLNVDVNGNGVIDEGDLYIDRDYDGLEDNPSVESVPSAPTGLKANIVGTTMELSWNVPANQGGGELEVLYYKLYVDGQLWETEEEITETSYKLENITAGKIYTVQVVAVNDLGDGARSDVLQLYVPASTAPSNLQYELTGYQQLTLTWDPPTAVNTQPAYYKLQINGLNDETRIYETEYKDNLSLDEEYVYRVYAVYTNEEGEEVEDSKTTEPVVVSTVIPTPAAPVIKTEVVTTVDEAKGIKVTFDSVENANGYQLYVDGELQELGEEFVSGYVYVPEDEEIHTIYVVAVNTVTAIDGEDHSKYSEKSNIVTASAKEKAKNEPDQVTDLVAVYDEAAATITLTWKKVDDVTDADDGSTVYTPIYVMHDASTDKTDGNIPEFFEEVVLSEVKDNLDGTVSYVVTDVSADKNYYYQVSARVTTTAGDVVDGAYSNMEKVCTYIVYPVPAAPANVKAEPAVDENGEFIIKDDGTIDIVLTWDANADADLVSEYVVYGEGATGAIEALDTVSVDTAVDGKLTYTVNVTAPTVGSSKNYIFQVSAKNEHESSKTSVFAEVDRETKFDPTTIPKPDGPQMLRYVFRNDTSAKETTITVYWKAPEIGVEGASSSNAYIDHYTFSLGDSMIAGENGEPLYTYNEETGEYSMVLDCRDTTNPIVSGEAYTINVISVAYVPVSEDENAETIERISDMATEPFKISYGLNDDTDGDGNANQNFDDNNDGELDDPSKIVTITGTVSASARTDIPLTLKLTKDGEAVAADRYTYEQSGNEFTISLKVEMLTTTSETSTEALAESSSYDVTVSKAGCLSHTVTGIPIDATMDSVDLGTVTLIVGNINGDTKISQADLNSVIRYLNQMINTENNTCDVSGDGKISQTDYNAVYRNLNKVETKAVYSAQ